MEHDASRTSAHRNARFLRLLQIVRAMASRQRGMTVAEIARLTDVSRASVYRDLEALEACGYTLLRVEVGPEVRHTLETYGTTVPANAPPVEARLAYEAMRGLFFAPLLGLEAVDALDAHFRRQSLRAPLVPDRAGEPPAAVVSVRRTITQALASGRRLRLRVRDPRARTDEWLEADPKGWRLVRGQPYLHVRLAHSGEPRLLKGRRILAVQTLDTPQSETAPRDARLGDAPDAAYDAPFEVQVAFPPTFGELLAEYPLNDRQTVVVAPDGRLEVRVPCSNMMGAVRWVLTWGGDAEVQGPPGLRARVAREALAIAARYAGA